MTRTPASSAPAGQVLPVTAIASRFPALARVYEGQPVAYFDGPGGTQVPQDVVDAMTEYLLHHNANTHWHFPTSLETDQLLDDARRALADFLNAAPSEIAFGNNMTTLAFHVGRALGRGWGPGDEIVVTELDHHANVAPWQAVARERGVTLRWVRCDAAKGQLDWDDFEQAVTPRTRLVAIGAASNAIGTINDVARAAALAHGVGALAFVDAVHYAPHALVDVRALGCDLLACSAYKFYGPHVGVLYGRHDLLASLDVPKLQPAPDTAPERLETGTQNHEGIVGAGRGGEVPRVAGGLCSWRVAVASRRAGTGVCRTPRARPRAGDAPSYRSAGPAGRDGLRPAGLGAADADGGLRRAGPAVRRSRARAGLARTVPVKRRLLRPDHRRAARPRAKTASCARAAPATRPRTKWSG